MRPKINVMESEKILTFEGDLNKALVSVWDCDLSECHFYNLKLK
jgi:hypothetical protein